MLALLRQRSYAALWWSALVSGIGNAILYAALPYYVYTISGSTLATGATFISETVPMIVFSSVGGTFADRWRRKRVMVWSDWLRGFLLLPLLAVHSSASLWIIYVVGFLGAAVANFTGPFGNAALPHIVRNDELPAANAAFSAGGFVAVLVGSPLGALLLQRSGLGAVVIADGATFALSALLTSSIGVSFEQRAAGASDATPAETYRAGAWRDWVQGLRYVLDQRWIRTLFAVMMLVFVGNSIIVVCLAPFVRHVLHGSAQIYGFILTAQGCGGVAASVVIGGVARRVPSERLLGAAILALGVLDLAIAVAASVPVTLVLATIAGAAILFGVAGMNTLLQATVPDRLRGRVSGTFLTASASASLVGSLIAGALADRVGIRLMLGLGGGMFLLAGGTAWARLVSLMRRLDASRTGPSASDRSVV